METGGCLDLLEASWARLGRRTKVWVSTLGIIGLGLVFGACALGMGWSLKAILDKREKTTFNSGEGPNQTTPHQTVFGNTTGYYPNNGSSLYQIQGKKSAIAEKIPPPCSIEESHLQRHLKEECESWYEARGAEVTIQCEKYACTPSGGTNLSSSKLTTTSMMFILMLVTPNTATRTALGVITLATAASATDAIDACQRRIFMEKIRGLEDRLKEALDTVASQAVVHQSSTKKNMQEMTVMLACCLLINSMLIISIKMTILILRLLKALVQMTLL